jgi:hypothetical protein
MTEGDYAEFAEALRILLDAERDGVTDRTRINEDMTAALRPFVRKIAAVAGRHMLSTPGFLAEMQERPEEFAAAIAATAMLYTYDALKESEGTKL